MFCKLQSIISHLSIIQDQFERRRLYNILCEFIGENSLAFPEEGVDVEEEVAVWNVFNHKTIGVYTLTEHAARRVERFLSELKLDISCYVNHDHAGTVALKEMVKKSDVLVVASSSAKHAATNVIMQCKGNKPILYPAGKGSSSIISVLRDYATG
ncbi:MAG: hypothetical protein EOO89_32410 [Pedobacter sp.]|nr:MAG: hypothetical protein EOO89_32410 [Pedobacter sp.]